MTCAKGEFAARYYSLVEEMAKPNRISADAAARIAGDAFSVVSEFIGPMRPRERGYEICKAIRRMLPGWSDCG